MIARLFERILPSSALKWGRLTKCWPWGGPIEAPDLVSEARRLHFDGTIAARALEDDK